MSSTEAVQLPHMTKEGRFKLIVEMAERGEYAPIAWAKEAAEAALSESAAIQDGWKLVPEKMTEAMIEAFCIQFFSEDWREAEKTCIAEAEDTYAAMLAAAPSPNGNEENKDG